MMNEGDEALVGGPALAAVVGVQVLAEEAERHQGEHEYYGEAQYGHQNQGDAWQVGKNRKHLTYRLMVSMNNCMSNWLIPANNWHTNITLLAECGYEEGKEAKK